MSTKERRCTRVTSSSGAKAVDSWYDVHQLHVNLVQAVHERTRSEFIEHAQTHKQTLQLHADVRVEKNEKNVDGDAVFHAQLSLAVLKQLFKETLVLDLDLTITQTIRL